MTYPFVPARWYTVGGIVEARAVLWHMAEGYSTVEYLTHPSLNVSAHFVIERSGEIVQMVKLRDASHSAHIAIDPDDADAGDCGIYDPRIAKQVVGSAGWADINAYVIAVEVEGFRATGPNDLQDAAIAELSTYLRGQLGTLRGNLGHRDVQDYKSCPGCLFPWDRIGGHGLYGNTAAMGVDDMAVQLPARVRSSYRIDVKADTPWWSNSALAGSPAGKIGQAATLDYFGATIGEPSRAVRVGTGIPYQDKVVRATLVYVRDDAGTPYYVAPDQGETPTDQATDLGPGLYRVS